MKIIRNKKNQIVIGVTESDIHYYDYELDGHKQEEQIIFFKENATSLSFDYIKDNVFRLSTILLLQVELGNLNNDYLEFTKDVLKKYTVEWEIIIDRMDMVPYEITLYDKEGAGPASSWRDKLYMTKEQDSFFLTSTREPYLSASEIIDYYGLEDDAFWDVVLDNGEMIETNSEVIVNAQDLIKNIKTILANTEQWDIPEDRIDWTIIIEILISNNSTRRIGKELKIIKT